MKRKPALRLLISSLPGSAWRKHVESLGKPRDVNNCFQSLDIKRHSPSILYASDKRSRYHLQDNSYWQDKGELSVCWGIHHHFLFSADFLQNQNIQKLFLNHHSVKQVGSRSGRSF